MTVEAPAAALIAIYDCLMAKPGPPQIEHANARNEKATFVAWLDRLLESEVKT